MERPDIKHYPLSDYSKYYTDLEKYIDHLEQPKTSEDKCNKVHCNCEKKAEVNRRKAGYNSVTSPKTSEDSTEVEGECKCCECGHEIDPALFTMGFSNMCGDCAF